MILKISKTILLLLLLLLLVVVAVVVLVPLLLLWLLPMIVRGGQMGNYCPSPGLWDLGHISLNSPIILVLNNERL